MVAKKFTQKEADEMYQLLTQIHGGLKDKNKYKKAMKMPSHELWWMLAIEKYLPKRKQLIQKKFKKLRKNLFSIKK